MSLTRKLLKGMSLTDEQVDTIIEAHTDTVDGLKAERDRYKADAEKLPGVQQELDALKGGEDWKTKYDTEHRAFEDYKKAAAAAEQTAKVREAYKALLTENKVGANQLDAIINVTDFSGMKIGEDGKLENADNLAADIKTKWGGFIVQNGTNGAHVDNPPKGGATITTRADIYKKDEHGRYVLSTAERQKALAEHPELMK